jgi:RNA polymerase sigma factor (sigma-70 family)
VSVDHETVAYTAANSVYRRYSRYIDREDLVQEARLFLWEHREKLAAKEERADSEGAAANWITKDVSGHLEKVARASKAAASGYEPEDEHFYAKGIIATVLPAVLSGTREPPRKALEGMPRAKSDPAESGDWLALWLDVESALRRLEENDVHLLVDRYGDEMTFDAIAERWGWASTDTAHRKVRGAESRLIEKLGGKKPKGCEDCAVCWEHDPTLRRRPRKHEEAW